MSIEGTEKIHTNFPLHSTKVQLSVLEVIPCEMFLDERTHIVGDYVQNLIERSLTTEEKILERDSVSI